MKIETLTKHTVGFIVDWGKGLKLPPGCQPVTPWSLLFPLEYQRAPAWSPNQKMMFIDSVLRGYSIPAFYFHARGKFVPPEGQGESQQVYHVVDGQQRIRAIREFAMNGFSLLDPKRDSGFKFPNFVRRAECPWAGKRFSELGEEWQRKFIDQSVVVYEITTNDNDEIRDLFIRLQSGTPLTPQDKRDAWPGNFTEFVLSIGGKPRLNPDDPDLYRGHEFFNSLVKGAPRSNTKRRLAAQIIMLHFRRMKGSLCDIKSQNLDVFYHESTNFEIGGAPGKEVHKIFDKLVRIFPDSKNLAGHEAIHLFFLVYSLMEEYAPGWERLLPEKFTEFRRRCKEADKTQRNNEESEYAEYWRRYTRWTRTSSDEKSTIESRHEFFVGEMLHLLNPTPLDSKRTFTGLERELVFMRDKGRCQWCEMKHELGEINAPHTLSLKDADIHHVVEYHKGGTTDLPNAALMGRECHHAVHSVGVERFQQWWTTRAKIGGGKGKEFRDLPSGTKCRFTYDEEEYNGLVENNQLVLPDIGRFRAFSGASKRVVGHQRNGWLDWEIQLPGQDEWILADAWRQGNHA